MTALQWSTGIHIDYHGRFVLSVSLIIDLILHSIMELSSAAWRLFLYFCILMFEQVNFATTAELSFGLITHESSLEGKIYDMCYHPSDIEILVFTSWESAHKVFFYRMEGTYVTSSFGHTDPGRSIHFINTLFNANGETQ